MLDTSKSLWYGTSGPASADIVIVGEAWGQEEATNERPFIGPSGIELNRMLAESGIERDRCLTSNVAAIRPQNNEFWRLFHPKVLSIARVRGLCPKPEVLSEMRRLYDQISSYPRRLVIGVGNYALWALSEATGTQTLRESNGRPIPAELQTYGPTGIMDWRGSQLFVEPTKEYLNGKSYPKIPFLPIIHSANILRQWSNRGVTVHDLKSRVPQALKDDWFDKWKPTFLAPPSFEECIAKLEEWSLRPSVRLAVDIETSRGFITCLGIADSATFAMSIPFIRKEELNFDSHWTEDQEAVVVDHLRKLFASERVLVEGQNFIYDTQYIQHWMGVTPRVDFDTMLAQNVAFPGTPKDLGYLSSLYCSYHRYWKEDHKEWNLSGTVQQLLRYNCEDCVRTWEIAESQRQLLKALSMESQMAFKMKVHHLCLRMMNRGVRIDTSRRASLLFDLNTSLQNLYQELYHVIPQDVVKPDSETPWYTSAQQKAFLLYDVLGLRQVSHRKTGNRTVGKEALRELKKRYPEFSGLFTRLDYAGSIANTVHVIRTPLDPDLRMRCSFNPGGTETHRLSSSENAFGRGTNLQNLTKGDEEDE